MFRSGAVIAITSNTNEELSTIVFAESFSQINCCGRLPERLLHFPGVAGAEKFIQTPWTFLCDHFLNLLVDDVFVARQIVPGTENADGSGESRAMFHVREQE